VPSETLDEFIAHHSISNTALIKMDTEGTENLILNGASKTLNTHKPIIICETLFHTIEDELEKVMLQHGYNFYNHKNGKLFKTETLIRKHDDGIRDCFFVHPEKVSLVREFTSHK
jgi:hypothetical protein